MAKTLFVFLLIYTYIGWPIQPPEKLSPEELHEIVGVAIFRDALTSKMSDTYFSVGDMRLNCSLGIFDGLNGCIYFKESVASHVPVKATYYNMPTRVGLRYPVLYRLEQGSKIIVHESLALNYVMKSYESRKSSHWQLMGLLVLMMIAANFIDRANIKRRKNTISEE